MENQEETVDIEIEVEEAGPEPSEAPVETAPDSKDDQFKKAESSTQKRIDRLTKKMREAERREKEAIRYAQGLQTESQNLKARMQNLDNNYVSEFSNRVTSQMQQAESALARAIDLGDAAATVEAQRNLTTLAIQADRANQAKAQSERAQQQAAAAQQHVARQPMPAQQPKRPDPKAEKWALQNSWFGSDEAMTYAAFGIHKKLVEEEGFDPTSDDYYSELDNRIASKFNTGKQATNRRPVQTVVGASRNNSGRSGKKVRLTPSQVAIAKKLGVPLEEYAKYVKE
jgi:hypothetical protein